jgi:hypothetical protein
MNIYIFYICINLYVDICIHIFDTTTFIYFIFNYYLRAKKSDHLGKMTIIVMYLCICIYSNTYLHMFIYVYKYLKLCLFILSLIIISHCFIFVKTVFRRITVTNKNPN